ncbi:MAG: type II toxin-antitoxin system death-on-curing family toxin [Dehalococcoidia bacterium]
MQNVLDFYAVLFGITPVQAADQLLRPQLLGSALSRPRNYAEYQNADLALQAAVLAHGIAEGQVFIDGNKRTALIAMTTFLGRNGQRITAPVEEVADWILALSAGSTAEELAEHIRTALVPFRPDGDP